MASLVIIGFDSEWTYDSKTDSNKVLSYQFAGRTEEGAWSGIIYPEGPEEKDRWQMVDLAGKAIEEGRKLKLLPYKWPTDIHLTAHFSRADIAAFKDFSKLKSNFDNVRGTYVTITERFKTDYYDRSKNAHPLNIRLIDTMLITPGGKSLAHLGELYKFPKISIPDGSLERMDLLLENDTALFEQYAIRDAEIAALHAWKMAKFARNHMGADKPPLTLASLALQHLADIWKKEKIDLLSVVGKENHTEQKFNLSTKRYSTIKNNVPISQVHDHQEFANECYHGGRNEAYMFGFTDPGNWTDFDLVGAYTTAMAAIREPDWVNIRVSNDHLEFKADELGLARVRFKFPNNTRYPCLPVRTDNGLVFPLEGIAQVASPEIVLARDMGAEIKLEHGVIIPWKSDMRPFVSFSRSIREMRDNSEKGSVEERTWKDMGNALYGKLAQGLHMKRVFDSRTDKMQILPPSEITQPYLAAYTTSLVRAVLGEIIHRIPSDFSVVSATTDGFISNIPENQIDLSGPISELFKDCLGLLRDEPSILEVKHFATQVLCWKTRGQVGVNVTGQRFVPLIAKAGIKPPVWASSDMILPEDAGGGEMSKDEQDEGWIQKLFLNREGGDTLPRSSLISMNAMSKDNKDMVPIVSDIHLNMEFDWKRELIDPTEQMQFGPYVKGGGRTFQTHHFTASSRPWKSIEAFRKTRLLFDRWRTERAGVLKTLDHWKSWDDFVTATQISKKGLRASKDGPLGQAILNIRKAYAMGIWGFSGKNYKEFADFFLNIKLKLQHYY